MATFVTVFLFIIGILVALVGIAGCLLPVIPGPLVSYAALLIIGLAESWESFSLTFLLIMAAGAVLMTLLDYFVSVAGAGKYGASRAGLWGSVVGTLVGLIFFPPLGIFIGALLGAVAGEMFSGKNTRESLRVGWGVFVGNLVGIGLKFAYCLVVLFFCIKEIFF